MWLGEERVQGDPRGPGGPPYYERRTSNAVLILPTLSDYGIRFVWNASFLA